MPKPNQKTCSTTNNRETVQPPPHSLDRHYFVAAGELSARERLATLAGPTAVLGI